MANIIKNTIGFDGRVIWDDSKPDGTPRKLMDISKLASLGWTYSTSLETGISKTYDWFKENIDNYRKLKVEK